MIDDLWYKNAIFYVVREGPFGYHRVNVAEQRRDPGSLLNTAPSGSFACGRSVQSLAGVTNSWFVQGRRNAVVAVHNFAAEAQEVTLPIPSAECAPLTNLLTPEHSSPDACGRHAVALEPYGYRWFRVGPLLDVITWEAR
jgi:maltose alpha-D-glucosyltransferase/alpha-amylase